MFASVHVSGMASCLLRWSCSVRGMGQHPVMLLPDGRTHHAGLSLAAEPLPNLACQKPGCGRCCSPAGGGCFYQQPWSQGFSLISFSSFLQPWICIRSWVRTNLIPGWEHCIRPRESFIPNCLLTECVVTGTRTAQGQTVAWVFLGNRRCLALYLI